MAGILVIDDDPDVQKLMHAFLTKHGFTVAIAANKNEAVDKIAAGMPDVVLLDVLLSGSDGRTFCKELKENERTQTIKVILFSAHPGVIDSIKECGADDFIAKPIDLTLLLHLIQQYVSLQ